MSYVEIAEKIGYCRTTVGQLVRRGGRVLTGEWGRRCCCAIAMAIAKEAPDALA